ncbi:hypothetical protein DMUE_2531 [Dictyocoela muelleri]|nr:hypothetical protein DMUE_2531 [Dictyocoela muelleri]
MELQRKFEETFMNGIPKELILKYSEMGLYDANSIMKRISETEKLYETFETVSLSNSTEQFKGLQANTLYKSKWCKLHKSKSHSDQECIAQRKQIKRDFKNKKLGRINNVETYTLSYLYINYNNKPIKFLLDSGANLSYIKQSLSIKL